MKGISAKQLKSPDEFLKSMFAFIRYVKNNTKLLLIIGSVIIVITGVFVSWKYVSNKKNMKSWNAIFEAEKVMDLAADKKIEAYKDLLGKMQTDSSKNYVMLKIADLYYEKKDWKDSEDFYGKVVKNDDGLLKNISLLGIASSRENNGEIEQAMKAFKEIASDENSLYRPMALLGVARCLLKKGEKLKAKEAYDNVIIAFPETDYARIASSAKSEL